jgi:hypothetical protein
MWMHAHIQVLIRVKDYDEKQPKPTSWLYNQDALCSKQSHSVRVCMCTYTLVVSCAQAWTNSVCVRRASVRAGRARRLTSTRRVWRKMCAEEGIIHILSPWYLFASIHVYAAWMMCLVLGWWRRLLFACRCIRRKLDRTHTHGPWHGTSSDGRSKDIVTDTQRKRERKGPYAKRI